MFIEDESVIDGAVPIARARREHYDGRRLVRSRVTEASSGFVALRRLIRTVGIG